MSEIEQFRLVLAVAVANSISDVALRTGVSQPTVTRAVKATERLVGYPLFERTPQGCTPTGSAPTAFALMESILADYDKLADHDGTHITPLRFAFRDGVFPTTLDAAIGSWNREKLVRARRIECADPIEMLRDGKVDFAVEIHRDELPNGMDHRTIRRLPSQQVDLVHIAPPTATVTEFLQFYSRY